MRAQGWRTTGAIAGLAALSLAIFFSPTMGGLAIGAVLALTCFAIGERLFRRFASKEEIRADLEDRVRNPPA
jgi:ammonia channel protein AmtB